MELLLTRTSSPIAWRADRADLLFVTMSSVAEGKAAISALEGKNFDGRNLTVNEARPKDEGAKRSSSKSRW
jgi:RNA recognition motif-containing protein